MIKFPKYYFLAISLLVFTIISLAFADYNSEKWQYFKEIKIIGAPSFGQLVEVFLDRDVFNNAKSDLSDLRILNESGSEIPYKLVVEKGVFSEKNIYPLKILNSSFVPGEYNSFIVDFGQRGFLNSELKILTSSENFRRQVEISGGNDAQNWNILKTDGYIYDYTDRKGNFKAQNTTVAYPENAYQYLQVKIFSVGEAPLAVSGAQVSKITKSATKETSITPLYEAFERDNKRVSGVIIDLEKKGWPTSNILLQISDENFNREAVIYESNDKNEWRLLGQSYIFHYNTAKFKGGNFNLSYPESNSRYLKVEIYNGDNQPVSISGISVKAILRNIVFQYVPGTNYYLYYGNNEARFPEYDLDKFFAYLETENYESAVLGPELKNSLFKPPVAPTPPLSERVPYLLPSVLILVIFVLGIFIFRFFGKVKT